MQDVHHHTNNNNNNQTGEDEQDSNSPVLVVGTTMLESQQQPVDPNKGARKRTNSVVDDIGEVGLVVVPKPKKKSRHQLQHELVDVVADMKDDLFVVGLSSDKNDRSCCCHKICGEYLQVGDLVRLIITIVTVRGKDEEVLFFHFIFILFEMHRLLSSFLLFVLVL